jgi:hypothetical protein
VKLVPLFLLAFSACAPVARSGMRPTSGEALPVTGRDFGPIQKFAAYLRSEETTELRSVYVLYSDTRLCIVDARMHAEVGIGDVFPCRWRFARR